MLRPLRLSLAACLGLLAFPAAAQAANETYYVANPGSGSACSKDVPCSLAQALINANDGDGGDADIIQMATGTYTGANARIAITDSDLAHLRVFGDPAGTTTLAPGTGTTPVIDTTVGDIGVDGVNVNTDSVITAAAIKQTAGVLLLKNLTIQHNLLGAEVGVDISGGGTSELENVTVRTAGLGSTSAVRVGGPTAGGLKVTNATLFPQSAVPGATELGIVNNSSAAQTFDVARTVIRVDREENENQVGRPIDLGDGIANRTLTLTDSILAGGLAGIRGAVSGGATMNLTIRRSSFDQGTLGTVDDIPTGAALSIGNSSSTVNLELRDSASVDGGGVSPGGTNTLICTNTTFSATETAFGPTSAPCSSTGVTTGVAPATLFPALTATSAQPNVNSDLTVIRPAVIAAFAPGIPLIDSATGEQAGALDVAGKPRKAGGSRCDSSGPFVDRGAIEFQGPFASPSCVGTPPNQPPVNPPVQTLTVSKTSLSPKSPKAKSAGSATLGFTLNRAGSVRVTIERVEKGRKSGKKCVKSTKKNRKKKSCTRYVKVVSKSVAGKAGANKVKLSTVLGKKKLKKAKYRISLLPAGSKKTSRISLTVKK